MARLTGWLLLWAPLPLLAEETAKAGENAASGGRAPDTVATILSLGAGLLAVVATLVDPPPPVPELAGGPKLS